MPITTPFLSVIIPLYNEENRVGNIYEVIKYLSENKFTWELILIDDGSTDNTKEIINKFKNNKVKIISYKKNRGKGYAIKQGMLTASGENRLFLDVDLSTPIKEFDKFLPFIGKNDVLIGTRKGKGSKVLVHQPWLREHLGKGFTLLSQIILNVPVSDFTCGFKCFSSSCAQKIFKHSLVYRWGFDSEILFLCRRFNFSIKEIPIIWRDDARTRVKFPEDIIRSLAELIIVRINAAQNLYS